jgi:hypothetical protein
MPDDVDNIESSRKWRTGDLFDPADNALAEGLDIPGSAGQGTEEGGD